MSAAVSETFDQALTFPDPDARRRLARLIGIDLQIHRLERQLVTLLDPSGIDEWANKHGYAESTYLLETFKGRPPLVVLAGDVGSGKTELAETIGDSIARNLGIDITLLPLSLATRGQGLVGEMTRLLANAFQAVTSAAERLKSATGKPKGGIILLIDEADALAQSREALQMHHEDKAGVNALIRGVNRLSARGLPAGVVMCTNRLSALDPAIRRRAADIIEFARPTEAMRAALLGQALNGMGFSEANLKELAKLCGPNKKRDFGFTFSDITQKFLPNLILAAYPTRGIDIKLARDTMNAVSATPPFTEAAS